MIQNQLGFTNNHPFVAMTDYFSPESFHAQCQNEFILLFWGFLFGARSLFFIIFCQLGEILVVRLGEKIPLDGTVVFGSGSGVCPLSLLPPHTLSLTHSSGKKNRPHHVDVAYHPETDKLGTFCLSL